MAIKKGDMVKVEYKGTLEDGSVFDSSELQGQPLEFEAGAGQMIKGFDDAVIGMEKGEEKDIKLEPDQAYGQPDPKLVKDFPKEMLPEDIKPEVGMILGMATADGGQIPAKVTRVTDKEITLDLNHPLAGETLNFHIKVV